MIITVSRQIGAGGGRVAAGVAAALGWRLVDNELVDRIATRAGLPREEVAEREERAPGFLERLVRTLSTAAPEIQPAPSEEVPELEEAKLVEITERVVEEAARDGRVVMVGRAASAVLSRERDALHVKIVAPKPVRIAAVAGRLGLDPAAAEVEVDRSDGARARYHRQYYDRDWSDAANYHLVINAGALGIDAAIATVVGRAKALWPPRL